MNNIARQKAKLVAYFFCNKVPPVIATSASKLASSDKVGAECSSDGDNTTMTPQNPTAMPSHCKARGFSPNKRMARAVVNNGWVDTISAVSAAPSPFAIA